MTVINFADAVFRIRLKRQFTGQELLDRRYDPAVRPAFLVGVVRGLRSQGATDDQIRAALDVVNDGVDRLTDREIEVIYQAGSTASLGR